MRLERTQVEARDHSCACKEINETNCLQVSSIMILATKQSNKSLKNFFSETVGVMYFVFVAFLIDSLF